MKFKFARAGLALLFVSALWGQSSQEIPAQIVQRAGAAHGSHRANGVDSVSEGTLTYFAGGGPKTTFEITLLRKGKTHVQRVIKQGSLEVRQGTDGVEAWDSIANRFRTSASGATLQFIESQTSRSVDVLFGHASDGLVLRDRGPSARARLIEAEDNRGRRTTYSIDAETNTVTRLEFVSNLGSDASGRLTFKRDAYVFSDYRSIDGILTPFKIERFSDGIKIEEMLFRSVRHNAALSETAFKP